MKLLEDLFGKVIVLIFFQLRPVPPREPLADQPLYHLVYQLVVDILEVFQSLHLLVLLHQVRVRVQVPALSASVALQPGLIRSKLTMMEKLVEQDAVWELVN